MKRALGQHLLADQQVLDRMVAAIAPRPDDEFVEVGPGTGRLTEPLLAAGASVRAIERDRRAAAMLAPRLGPLAQRLEVTVGDAARRLPVPDAGMWRLAGNLPYQISSPLLLSLGAHAQTLKDAHVMVQREFALRAAAPAGCREYGRLSVSLQASFDVQLLFEVPPSAFIPRPQVDSAVLRLVPLAVPLQPADPAAFAAIVRLAFGQRRKKLSNALGAYAPLAAKLRDLRAEQLAVRDYVALADEASAGMRDAGK